MVAEEIVLSLPSRGFQNLVEVIHKQIRRVSLAIRLLIRRKTPTISISFLDLINRLDWAIMKWGNRQRFAVRQVSNVNLDFSFRLEICNYSGYKIYPGHGKRAVRTDGKVSDEFRDSSMPMARPCLFFTFRCISTWAGSVNDRLICAAIHDVWHGLSTIDENTAKEQRNKKWRSAHVVPSNFNVPSPVWHWTKFSLNEINNPNFARPNDKTPSREPFFSFAVRKTLSTCPTSAAKQAKKVKSQQKKVAQPAGPKVRLELRL